MKIERMERMGDTCTIETESSAVYRTSKKQENKKRVKKC